MHDNLNSSLNVGLDIVGVKKFCGAERDDAAQREEED